MPRDRQTSAPPARHETGPASAARRPTKPGQLPGPDGLPEARKLRGPNNVELVEFSLRLRLVTPVFGGGYRARQLDDVDRVRVPTVRGHLRFWWRALHGHEHVTAKGLFDAESALWGGTSGEQGRRSPAELRITLVRPEAGSVDRSDVSWKTLGAYALWPARAEKKNGGGDGGGSGRSGRGPGADRGDDANGEPAPRRLPGLTFVLTVRCPRDRETEVRNAIRAWLLFGGYGGRTRRGSGSLTVVDEPSAGPGGSRSAWLPRAATREAMRELFDGIDIFAPPSHPASVGDTPWLAGATLSLRTTPADGAEKAWLQALDWLRDFRQGAPPRRLDQGKGRTMTQGRADPTPPGAAAGDDGDATYARRSGSDPKRPGISNWPEPDKVRHFSTPSLGPWAHDPGRHNQVAAWPRAGFGLPIIGRFQQKDRNDKFWRASGCCEPDDYQLLWRDPVPPAARANEPTAPRERLASPVIVKALPLSGGRFVPCALWLNRAYPQGEVGLYRKRGGPLELVPGSGAPFGRLVAPGDEVFFLALRDKASLRQAFLDWLRDERKCDQRVAP